MIGLGEILMTARNNFPKTQTNGRSTDASHATTPPTPELPQPKRRAKVQKTALAKAAPSKKQSVKTVAKKATSSSPPNRTEPFEPTEADIRLRAYFIAERRLQFALRGDPTKDWLDARQQLLEEAARHERSQAGA